MRNTLSKLWTDAVAYVALLLGAFTSMAGNVANVLRVRGDATDGLDIFMAMFFPGLVVLMVEVFVSSRWRGLHWPMQVLRWTGCASVTIVAMRVSWVHLNGLMLARGQERDVSTFGPLAIDFLAIMATALILAGRGRVQTPVVQAPVSTPVVQAPVVQDTEDMDIFARLEREMATDMASLPVPVSPAPANGERVVRTRARKADMSEAENLARIGRAHGLGAGEISELLGGWYEVSARTIRRLPWWTEVTGKRGQEAS